MKAVRLFLVIFSGLFIVSCGSRQDNAAGYSPEYNPYVNAFTSGNISVKSNITVQLSEESVFEHNEQLPENLFSISPSVKGKAEMINARTIVFVPSEKLKVNQNYTVTFDVGKALKSVDKQYRKFEFGFSTIKPSFYMMRDGLKLYTESMPHLFRLVRDVNISDYAEPADVEKMLTVTLKDKTPIVRWEHQGNRHTFTVDSLKAGDSAYELGISLNAKAIGGDVADEEKIRVPSKFEFDILSVTVSDEDKDRVIICRFSAPIDQKQNLKGIVTLENAKFTYRIVLNTIMIYPSDKLVGQMTIAISKELKSANGGKFSRNYTEDLIFASNYPEVRFLTKGNILPTTENGTVLPFMAVSLRSVTVKIIKIYEKNILQFLQVNNLAGASELRRAGRIVSVKTINLDENRTEKELKRWNTYSLDMSKFILPEPGAIYRIEISFKRSQAITECDEESDTQTKSREQTDEEMFAALDAKYDDTQYGYYYDDNDYYDYYDDYYSDRENPCKNAYYRNKTVSKNILASDLGIIAKQGTNNQIRFIVTNIQRVTPVASVLVEVYNYQQQLIGSGTTGPEGFADINIKGKAFIAVAKYGSQRGYLHLETGKALSLSRFDVAGEAVKNGVKGFIYGERGVWRPGDSIFLTFILQDNENTIPASHPVTLELMSATGQIVSKQSKVGGVNGFYTFVCQTSDEAPTGNWTATFKVGGQSFSKTLKVETIKPNRLKLNIDFNQKEIDLNETVKGTLSAAWLHGAPVKNLETKIELFLSKMQTVFKGFEAYAFDDPTCPFEIEQRTFFTGKLNDKGSVEFSEKIALDEKAPGKLRANFVTRVFEESGDFSIDNFGIDVSPYKRYVGIKQPKGTGYGNMLETDKDQPFDILLLDKSGVPVEEKTELKVSIYKVSWTWWWSSSSDQLANFNYSSFQTPIYEETIKISGGRGVFAYKAEHRNYGLYLIRIKDNNGHSTSTMAYYDWPGWGGRARQESEGATMLNFESDKESYNVGETVVVKFPSANTSKALVNIENGTKVLKSYWVECYDNETKIEVKTTPEMTPNVYLSITLIQPHLQTQNDMPVRLFGVIPIKVEDPDTKLQPVLTVPETIRPGEKYKIAVSESRGVPMTYTLAVVDEGLLDLTRFKTPNPWTSFFAKEALGVNTWDMYEYLIGAYGGNIEQMFAIGGDGSALANRTKVNRFKPVVRFIGPFSLEKGQKQTHELEMHNYIGSVRVMVVAGNRKAYGIAEKAVPVKKPLMVLATMPRVLSPGEEIRLPVTVFATDEKISRADISVEANDLFTVEESKKTVSFAGVGEEMATFKMKVREKIGAGKVKIKASSGNEHSDYEIDIEIRTPNPPISKVKSFILEAGKKESFTAELVGMEGTNTAQLEASYIPPINSGKRLQYLIRYPHGCLEQTTSAAFPQLYLGSVIDLSEGAKTEASYNVKAALNKLRDFVGSEGGFTYWSGNASYDSWTTSYVGDFLLEAEKKGFSLPGGMKQGWIRFQQKRAREWTQGSQRDAYLQADLVQAYRLYSLAKAKSPELGAMNRLKEERSLSIQARWILAATYVLAGQPEIADNLVANASTTVNKYTNFTETFGSETRDLAMMLDAMILLKRESQAFEIVKTLSETLNSQEWLSTQSTAYALMGVSRYAETIKDNKSISLDYSFSNIKDKVNSKKPFWLANLGKVSSGKFEVENKATNSVYVQLTTIGIPLAGQETAQESKIKIEVTYISENGVINPEKLTQGTDFAAKVKVTNLSASHERYTNLALTQIFPSGWEIMNERLLGLSSAQSSVYDYCDIRDDRVSTYFSLAGGETKTFEVALNAAYIGRFYLPASKVEAMYDGSITANTKGQWVEVIEN